MHGLFGYNFFYNSINTAFQGFISPLVLFFLVIFRNEVDLGYVDNKEEVVVLLSVHRYCLPVAFLLYLKQFFTQRSNMSLCASIWLIDFHFCVVLMYNHTLLLDELGSHSKSSLSVGEKKKSIKCN